MKSYLISLVYNLKWLGLTDFSFNPLVGCLVVSYLRTDISPTSILNDKIIAPPDSKSMYNPPGGEH